MIEKHLRERINFTYYINNIYLYYCFVRKIVSAILNSTKPCNNTMAFLFTLSTIIL